MSFDNKTHMSGILNKKCAMSSDGHLKKKNKKKTRTPRRSISHLHRAKSIDREI